MAKPKRGRDPKLTPEVQKVIVDRVASGVPLKYAAQAAGIGERTLRRWVADGKSGAKPFTALVAALKKAEADAIARNVGLIQKEAAKTWTAAAWWLERRHPKQFGNSRREVNELKREIAKLQAGQTTTPATGVPVADTFTRLFLPIEAGPNDAQPDPPAES